MPGKILKMGKGIEDSLEDVLKSILKCMSQESAYKLGYNYLRRNGDINLAILEKLQGFPFLLNSYMSGANDYLRDSKEGEIKQELLIEMDNI